MKTYKTSQVAALIGIHPNTVRLYEELELIPRPERLWNGYRVFTEFHIEQFRLARLGFQVEVLQNGIRKKVIQLVKASAAGDFDGALQLAGEYLEMVRLEYRHAEEAIELAKQILYGGEQEKLPGRFMRRREVSDYLGISMDTLRNWEMNGLLSVRRRQNGYRVYLDEDIRRLKIIRSLRCANYSLEAILRMLHQLSTNPDTDIKTALDTPNEEEDIIAVCDRLLSSLLAAEENALKMTAMLLDMKKRFS